MYVLKQEGTITLRKKKVKDISVNAESFSTFGQTMQYEHCYYITNVFSIATLHCTDVLFAVS